MRSMYRQLGILGTISAFAHGQRKTKKTASMWPVAGLSGPCPLDSGPVTNVI